ncbi:MAG TPA: hypothetical protein P5244_07925 [Syntrophales bacterium]|nr:hypothetical protein [Syntrophales bacterium]
MKKFRGTLYFGKDMQALTGEFSLRLKPHGELPDILLFGGKLSETLDFPALFAIYPALSVETRIFIDPGDTRVDGRFCSRRGKEEIVVLAQTEVQAAGILLHEVQHWIQREEQTLPLISRAWFAGRADEYIRLPGEAQARKAQESVVLVEES